jgi:hypothetical protein
LAEHFIRLRGGWECCAMDAPNQVARRLTLPTVWSEGEAPRLRLTRRFGRPPLDRGCQALSLRLERVPGILSLELNGRSVVSLSPETSSYRIELDDLPARNVLLIEFERHGRCRGSTPESDWGEIALVISSVDPGPTPST